jgi:NAD/NADP transhydrogenase beta subunit
MSLLNHWVRIAFACAGIALGLLVCCLGVRVLKFCVFLMGFCIGAVVGGVIAWRISLDDKATLIAAFSTGAVVGLLCVFIVKFGRFIAAAAVGFLPVFLFIQTGGSKVRTVFRSVSRRVG